MHYRARHSAQCVFLVNALYNSYRYEVIASDSCSDFSLLCPYQLFAPLFPPGATCGKSRGIFLSFEQNTCPKGGEFDLMLEIIF